MTESTQANSKDFVIREGFPALRLPNGGPFIEGDEPLPRQPFWAHEKALSFPDSILKSLLADCETVFSARAKDANEAYSAGITYFCPCQMKPRCVLEELALDIFRKHTEKLDKTYFIPEQSGAEWWTLVLDDQPCDASKSDESDDGDESDEVGMHFDADYGLEDQAPNLLLHPRLATVTYLSDCGAPTVVFDRRSPLPNDTQMKALCGPIERAWLSHPRIGKHIAFDGRLLHGAPATFFPSSPDMTKTDDNETPPAAKKIKLEETQGKRYTLLVNIWLNHCPLDAELLDDDVVERLVAPLANLKKVGDIECDDSPPRPFEWSSDFTPQSRSSDDCFAIAIEPSADDPAGEEETVICNRRVCIHYDANMNELHQACTKASLVEFKFKKGAVYITVGDVVNNETDQEE